MDKGYENLAASIGSTVKSYTSTILIAFNSLKSSIFQASRASHSWEAVNNHMRSCKSPWKPVRQVREPSEGFELRHSFYMQESINWSSKLIFQRKVVGDSPC